MNFYFNLKFFLILLSVGFCFASFTPAQFMDNFNENSISYDSSAINGWAFYTGDGFAKMTFTSNGGYASINVDATKDKQGIWWALIRHYISGNMDLNLLRNPNYQLRIEAKIRVSDAPKRVNLHLNTRRTTDFHSKLMEYDIPDTTNWHIISMTTKEFEVLPGDSIFGQLALMDWGLKQYRVDLDYVSVDIVNIDSVDADKGEPLQYRPPIPQIDAFNNHLPVTGDAIIDTQYPELNFNNWLTKSEDGEVNLLTVNGIQYIILRWDLSKFNGKKVTGAGLLELTTFSLQNSPDYKKDFGMIRVSEIIMGDREWNQENVTFDSFCKGNSVDNVINSQMIIDVDVNPGKGSKTFITISRPVLQRMVDGKTLGIVIKPLGAVNASFYSMENIDSGAKLHLNIAGNFK